MGDRSVLDRLLVRFVIFSSPKDPKMRLNGVTRTCREQNFQPSLEDEGMRDDQAGPFRWRIVPAPLIVTQTVLTHPYTIE